MGELGHFVRACKSPPPAHRLDEPVAMWRERELLDGTEVETAVAILRTRGCYWSLREGCAMCGYFGDTVPEGVSAEALEAQWQRVLRHVGDARYVKLYTSGSFLDPHEVPREFAVHALADLAAAGVAQVLVESLPEFVQPRLLRFPGAPRLEIAIGLEKDSIVFYQSMKSAVPKDLGQQRIDDIIDQEIGHILTLTKQLTGQPQ